MSRMLSLAPNPPGILSFHGPDSVRYLNGQLTQDVSLLGARALPSCVTDAKGRLQHMVTVCHGPDDSSLWVVAPSSQIPDLHQRLSRYLIADEVEIEDLSGDWTLIHRAADPSPAGESFRRQRDGIFGDGDDLWFRSPEIPRMDPVCDDRAESLRIAARIPEWGNELVPGMLPPEAGLDRNAISYHKGCYIGQEVLSRIKSAGKLNRRLAGLQVGPESRAGDRLMIADQPAGQLTSVSPTPGSGGLVAALGYLNKVGMATREFEVVSADGMSRGTAVFTAWA